MIINLLIWLLDLIEALLFLLIILHVVFSFFLDPYNRLRRSVDSIVAPMLDPIRRVVPLIGGFDLSPLILILLISVLKFAIVNLLMTLR